LGNLATPRSVQKLQRALHAKAKAEAGYRFYALYDKIYREDILAHAYAQCRSNKGAPGIDGQEFADVEAYGVQRWLGELALALERGELPTRSYQTSVHPEGQWQASAAGHLDAARSSVHECSAAGARAHLRSRPSTGAIRLPSWEKRPAGVVEVEELLYRGHPEVVDADLADYLDPSSH
jgi:hypothetical protein